MLTNLSTFDIMYDSSSLLVCPERDELIERYNILYRECEMLKYRIAHNSSSSLSTKHSNYSSYSVPSSPTSPPTLAVWTSSQCTFSTQNDFYPSSGLLTPPSEEGLDNEHTLMDFNGQIKAVLTSLLNCESVKHDTQVRSWVQDRLMDAEHAMRRQRRRKSSADRDVRRQCDLVSLPGSRVSHHQGKVVC